MRFPTTWLIWPILALALLVRLPLLNGSFWLDEAAQALEVTRPWYQQLDIVADFQPPLLHLLLHLAHYLSHAEWWLRAVGALLPGLLSIWISFRLGHRFFSTQVGTLTALLLATNTFHIYYSQELRPYMLPTLWAVVSTYFLFILWEKKPSKRAQLGFALSTLLGLLSMYVYPFVLFGQLLTTLVFFRKKSTQVVIPTAVAALGWLPLTPLFLSQLAAGRAVQTDLPGWSTAVSSPQLKALPLTIGKWVYGVTPLDMTAWVVLSFVTLVILGAVVFWRTRGSWDTPTRALMLLVVSALLSSWLFSFWIPVVQPKRLLTLQPLFFLLISHFSLLTMQKKPHLLSIRHPGCLLALVLLGVNLISLHRYWTDPSLQRENWRSLYTNIQANHSASDTVVVFSFPEPFAPWVWYERNLHLDDPILPTLNTGRLTVDEAAIDTLRASTAPFDSVLFFDYLTDLTDADGRLRTAILSQGREETIPYDSPGIGFVRKFRYNGPY